MRMVGMMVVAALALVSLAGQRAEAATITQAFDFVATKLTATNGNPLPRDRVAGSFTLTYDNTLSYTDVSTGLKLKTLNLRTTAPVVFSYNPTEQELTVGGAGRANQYVWGTDDFLLSLSVAGGGVSGSLFGYSVAGINDSFQTYRILAHVATTSPAQARVAVVAATPLPGSVLLLLTALATLTGLAWLRAQSRAALAAHA
jgi:hypothetical protein